MLGLTRRKLLGASLFGAGALLSKVGLGNTGENLIRKGQFNLRGLPELSEGMFDAINFPLIEAIQGRRSRRFAMGASIPDGPLAFTSNHDPKPLTSLEQLMLLTTMSGNTGWSNLIPYNANYSPNIPNYAGAAGGRTFPSAAGFHTTELFYTDDKGSYFFGTKDLPSQMGNPYDSLDLNQYLKSHKRCISKIDNKRISIPRTAEHMEVHNHWCSNVEGSTLIIPVADLAQHHILGLCYIVQNGACIFDDVHNRKIPGIEKFSHMVDIDNPYPLSYLEQISLSEVTLEVSIACYSGMLMLQAMGLGGWMYGGINPFSILGASGDPKVKGLGFDSEMTPLSVLPNVTGLKGVFEGTCPPNYPTMKDAVEAVILRKYGSGGPFNSGTSGPYKNNSKIRGSGVPSTKELIECVTAMAQYTFDTFGRCPGQMSSIFTMMYLQAQNLDTKFHDTHFSQGSYLRTHVDRERKWGTSTKY